MRTIWKFTLPDPGDINSERLPVGARVVAAGVQEGAHVCWVEVDDSKPLVDTALHVMGTGWPVPTEFYDDRLAYRATFQSGPFVWHVYQGVPEEIQVPW